MANIPYFELGGYQGTRLAQEDYVDEYRGIREGLAVMDKFVEQQETIETSKKLAQARADWNVRLNKLQEERGLDAEGFSNDVNNMMKDYKNEIMATIPARQRAKFEGEFAGLEFDVMSKVNLYEAKSLSQKMVNNVNETIDLNANSLVSDYTQRARITEDTDSMIDDISGLSNTVKEELKKDAHAKYAVTEINALGENNPYALKQNLMNGVYDRDITSDKKTAALSMADRMIKQREAEARVAQKEAYNQAVEQWEALIENGSARETDIDDMKKQFAGDYKTINRLEKLFNKKKKDGLNVLETQELLLENAIDGTDDTHQKWLDMLYEKNTANADDFNALKVNAYNIVEKSGYLPKGFKNTLMGMYNGGNNNDKKNASVALWELKQVNPSLVTGLGKEIERKMNIIGTASAIGYDGQKMNDLLKDINIVSDPASSQQRNRKYKDLNLKPNNYSDNASVSGLFDKIARDVYVQFGDGELAEAMGNQYVEQNYGDNFVGIKDTSWFSDGELMYRPPVKEYRYLLPANASDSDVEDFLSDDLLYTVKKLIPDVKKEQITLGQDIAYDKRDGKRIYHIYVDGNPLVIGAEPMLWRPDTTVEFEKLKRLMDGVE